jgi:plasmid stabilization system protein ParE
VTNQVFAPGPTPDTVTHPDGRVMEPPPEWSLLPPGDAALTRRVKAKGEFWIVQEKKGRKMFSRGVWASTKLIESIRENLEAERGTESYAKKRAASTRRRAKVQAEYVEGFEGAVLTFLSFHARYQKQAKRLARLVTELATPVGSGTVARTKRIPVERRAEAAVIAWLRHQTTGYDDMVIPRVRGKRREVRRMLAQRSKRLLQQYQRGEDIAVDCPLQVALSAFS